MTKYKLYAGLGGSFGGAQYQGTYEYDSISEATEDAYDLAWEEYESYAGLHGLLDREEVRQDVADSFYDGDIDAVSEEEAQEYYIEQVEGWIEYYAKLDDGAEEEE